MWCVIKGYDCWIEDGCVFRILIGSGVNQRVAFPYTYNASLGCYVRCSPSVSTFRRWLRAGSVLIA